MPEPALALYAGPAARRHIERHGLSPADVATVPAAAGGPKGLILGPLDRFIFGQWLPQAAQPVDLVGQTNLKQLLALIGEASLVLAPDTGPTHMATIVGTPVIGLYAHHNPARTGPYLCRDYVVSVYQELVEQETGKPLAELSWRTRLKDPEAMAKITHEQVIAAFDRLCADRQLPY